MSKEFCTWVELNKEGVLELMNDKAIYDYVKDVANEKAKIAGENAKAEMGTRSKRPIAFVSLPYQEATKDNNFIKKMFGSKK